jgi:hypothetical protein
MKTRILLLAILIASQAVTAQKYISKNGHIWFIASTPLENIEAHNNQAVSVLNPDDGTIQFLLLIKSFEFKVALMQEHFNENYMESDKIPKASFTGKVTSIDQIDFKKDGTYPAEVTGDLTIHGVTKSVSVRGTFTVSGKTLYAKAKFITMPKDYNINIPAVVENKIAKEVEVNLDVTYNQN